MSGGVGGRGLRGPLLPDCSATSSKWESYILYLKSSLERGLCKDLILAGVKEKI